MQWNKEPREICTAWTTMKCAYNGKRGNDTTWVTGNLEWTGLEDGKECCRAKWIKRGEHDQQKYGVLVLENKLIENPEN